MELWKTIPGYEGTYEVSSFGNVRRISPACIMHRKLTPESIAKIHQLRQEGLPFRKIGSRFYISENVIRRIISKRAYLPSPKKILIPALNRTGYPFVVLSQGGSTSQRVIHRLVMLAFVGECPIGKEVNHIDGVRNNPRLENLEYVTRSQNQLHKVDVLGKSHKINLAIARTIKRRAIAGERRKDLAKEYSVSIALIDQIVQGRAWHRD